MEVLQRIKPNNMVNAFMVFFVVHATQIGVGLQGFQRIIYQDAQQDAWISVLISGFGTNILVYVIIKTLELYDSSDIYGIHHDVYGVLLGKLFNVVYIFYSLLSFFVVLRNYIEVIQAWIFPELPLWFLSFSMLLLVIYGITSGVRSIIGISFFSVTLSLWLLLFLMYPLQYARWDQMLPLLEADIASLLKGAFNMTFTVLGFEILYTIYPFLKEKEKVQRFAQYGLLFTTLIYTTLMIVAIVYFSGTQLERTVWATLSLFKVVHLPFIERFEYVAITFWMLIILPNLIFYMWSACQGIKRMFQIKEEKSIWLLSVIVMIGVQLIVTRNQVNMLNDYFAKCAFYVVFCYPFLLYGIAWVKKKISSRSKS
ncbi:GerAB/ArcD/ProY family transporter [Fictibacillus sp. 5RED26]|uniref:GerAB/ArcD/ProY family transporter n=1 Tax=unclassified Fictibacillus TaxID=2644029 RepID=UPI0018CCF4C7|nr:MULTISPECIES: GerAB/ArcD/ProY family transporter [unclassified Fictibacillus]MBH0158616.1 GerAB/ArcD/ProY family transporter [Fictibacillus sp. 5RED26]MBH0175725.1 GerAB/ArcD/ProY family transporter [Fictibacillus sp. 23RED33]